MELEALQAVIPAIESKGGSLVVISPQLEKYSKQISKKLNLTYPVLCDLNNQAAEALGLAFDLPGTLKEIYANFGIDLERFNGDSSWQLPMPARFIVSSPGVIDNVEVNPDYTVRPEPALIADILDTVQ